MLFMRRRVNFSLSPTVGSLLLISFFEPKSKLGFVSLNHSCHCGSRVEVIKDPKTAVSTVIDSIQHFCLTSEF